MKRYKQVTKAISRAAVSFKQWAKNGQILAKLVKHKVPGSSYPLKTTQKK